jgi:hypothetical protein
MSFILKSIKLYFLGLLSCLNFIVTCVIASVLGCFLALLCGPKTFRDYPNSVVSGAQNYFQIQQKQGGEK